MGRNPQIPFKGKIGPAAANHRRAQEDFLRQQAQKHWQRSLGPQEISEEDKKNAELFAKIMAEIIEEDRAREKKNAPKMRPLSKEEERHLANRKNLERLDRILQPQARRRKLVL